MGYYRDFSSYAEKWEGISGSLGRFYGGRLKQVQAKAMRIRMGLPTLLMVTMREFERRALARSRSILIRDIYRRYIPTKSEYDRIRKRGDPSYRALQRAFRTRPRPPGERARKRAAKAGGGAQKDQKAWKRFGRLISAERAESGFDAGEDAFWVKLSNAATNNAGDHYARDRSDLGMPGQKKNSIWTKSVQWQTQALRQLRPFFNRTVARRVHDLFHS